MSTKDMREKRAKAHAYAVSLIAKGIKTNEQRQEFDRAMTEVDTIGADLQRYERAGMGKSGYAEIADRNNPWTSEREVRAALAFGKYLRHGKTKLEADDLQALRERRAEEEGDLLGQIGSYTGLGFFVPAGFVYDVDVATKWYADLLNVCGSLNTATGNPLPYPTSNDTDQSAQIVAESIDVQGVELGRGNPSRIDQDVTASHVNFGAWKYTAGLIKVSIEMAQDSAFNLESFLSERFGARFGRGYERDFTNGTGSNEPAGIIPEIAASGATPVVAHGSSDSTGGAETGANSVGYTDLVRLEHAVDPSYRRRASYMLHDTTLSYLKRILDKFGRPLWTPGMKDGAPDTIVSYPYSINQSFPSIGASNTVVAFGDFKKYVIRVVKGMQVLRLDERFAEFGQIGYLGFARRDGRLVDAGTHPLNVLINAS